MRVTYIFLTVAALVGFFVEPQVARYMQGYKNVHVAATVVQLKTAPQGSLSLITEPDAGVAPVLTLIQRATKSVDLVAYELEDPQVEQALADASSRGVAVRVILNEGYYGKQENTNAAAYAFLQTQHVPVAWAPAYFALTHQKTLVVDNNDALIMTFNLVPKYYASGRDFAVNDTDQADIVAIEQTFANDWQGSRAQALPGDDLLWSPGSEGEMVSLINSATSSLKIYNEEMADPAVIAALKAAAARGVVVQVDMTYATSWKAAFAELVAAGVELRTYASTATAPLYIHAKVIIVDNTTAFVGSQNFSTTSLNNSRELGLVLADPTIVQQLTQTFAADWAGARSLRK